MRADLRRVAPLITIYQENKDMFITRAEIKYKASPYGYIATIPAGTQCTPASNLPGDDPGFWVGQWDDMTDEAQSWMRNYGFHLDGSEVIQTTPDSIRTLGRLCSDAAAAEGFRDYMNHYLTAARWGADHGLDYAAALYVLNRGKAVHNASATGGAE
jgi:hypothetical protein